MSTTNDPNQFDMKLVNALIDISHGPEMVGCKSLEVIIDLVYQYPNSIETLIFRVEQFIDAAPPAYLLAGLYLIDSLIRYLSDENAITVEQRLTSKLSEIIRRICNTPLTTREKARTLLEHWQRHKTFGDELIESCINILRRSEIPNDINAIKIKTNVILLTQLPSDWNEYRIKEYANEVTQVLRVSTKSERHFAFIATPTRSDAEKLKEVLQRRVAETKGHIIPKVVWGTEYWMKSFKFEDEEGICTISKDKIPPDIIVNEQDGTYTVQRPNDMRMSIRMSREEPYNSRRYMPRPRSRESVSQRERSESRG
ncbi:hypothetical protein EHI8A_100960 [Entamoeba histolytica HM-1:IMSS-B]|uniref:CID domain-containing protein n=7 Tax=Entamoeba TaxID=5758 RepID=C4M219_ENTH1|nr:hypothetical protein EHI_150380 [Entamoeba histolytica HM-1:IMSS]EMD49654.1 Hypothetical protein EHI5A_127090 [Entamoeba histolytica KU27]EMH74869.1 hypothetical protein EHI8A_100960 [Entamoeba histolytica HM-1:IMSS-B]EMS15579.1 hypothetical protein KM1_160460 [Entamoeba histolytica HM-3:IMSS]ENY62704.1 hypothetical protein EHI7A_096530 [Entamoeba histolytica HM-1:IMSS-A]GAT95299.1 hypothetical protein CL6EHI_150380 [Entamoeba histolytica]|eukprot:XP_655828.1 hypothetical protein EHI_150380 [Entamoeba histolytica HM-1:IMSS]